MAGTSKTRAGARWVTLAIGAIGLAACGPGDSPGGVGIVVSAEPGDVTAGTRIEGLVVESADASPIGGAVVTLEPDGQRLRTTEGGAFVFTEDIKGGALYRIRASGEGFDDTSGTVVGIEGRAQRITLTLSPTGQTPALAAAPNPLRFGTNAHTLPLQIRNTTEAEATFDIRALPPWLEVPRTGGAISPNGRVVVAARLVPELLEGDGEDTARFEIRDQRGHIIYIETSVDLTTPEARDAKLAWVTPPPVTVARGDRVPLRATLTARDAPVTGSPVVLAFDLEGARFTRRTISDEAGRVSFTLDAALPGVLTGTLTSLAYPEASATLTMEITGAPIDPDADGDGVEDEDDNCPIDANPDQTDTDGDGVGDACEPPDEDADADGVLDGVDNCPIDANPDQTDTDGDGVGDACEPSDEDADADDVLDGVDNCPVDFNPDQRDFDVNGVGDVCDPDGDGDSVANTDDNCPFVANADQADFDGDGVGDACHACPGDPDPQLDTCRDCGADTSVDCACAVTETCFDCVDEDAGPCPAGQGLACEPSQLFYILGDEIQVTRRFLDGDPVVIAEQWSLTGGEGALDLDSGDARLTAPVTGVYTITHSALLEDGYTYACAATVEVLDEITLEVNLEPGDGVTGPRLHLLSPDALFWFDGEQDCFDETCGVTRPDWSSPSGADDPRYGATQDGAEAIALPQMAVGDPYVIGVEIGAGAMVGDTITLTIDCLGIFTSYEYAVQDDAQPYIWLGGVITFDGVDCAFSNNDATLTFEDAALSPYGGCDVDLGSDTVEGALPPSTGVTYQWCPEDVDHFLLQERSGCSFMAALTSLFPYRAGDNLSVALVNQAGEVLSSLEQSADAPLTFTGVLSEPGQYLRVSGAGERRLDYTLDVELDCTTTAPTCPQDDHFEPNSTIDAAAPLLGNLSPAILCDAGDEDWYTVELPERCTLDLTMEDALSAGVVVTTFDNLEDRTVAELRTVAGFGRQTLRSSAFAASTLYVRVTSADGMGSGTYDLDAHLRCDDLLACPGDDLRLGNQTREEAARIDPLRVTRGILCPGLEDWLTFKIPSGNDTINVIVTPDDLSSGDEMTVEFEYLLGGQQVVVETIWMGSSLQNNVANSDDGWYRVRVVGPPDRPAGYTFEVETNSTLTMCNPIMTDMSRDTSLTPGPPVDVLLCASARWTATWDIEPLDVGCAFVGAVGASYSAGVMAMTLRRDSAPDIATSFVNAETFMFEDGITSSVQAEIVNSTLGDWHGQAAGDIVCFDAGACDTPDPGGANDDIASAIPVEDVKIVRERACPGDVDWFAVDPPPKALVALEIVYPAGEGDLHLEVLDPFGRLISALRDGPGKLRFETRAAGGRYRIGVTNPDAISTGYGLAVATGEISHDAGDDDDDDIEHATPLHLRDTDTLLDAVETLATVTGAVGANPSLDTFDYYRLDVPQNCALDLTLSHWAFGGELELVLKDAEGSIIDMGTAVNANTITIDDIVASGPVYAVVSSLPDNTYAPYHLEARADCAVRCDGMTGEDDHNNNSTTDAVELSEQRIARHVACAFDDYFVVRDVAPGCEVIGTFQLVGVDREAEFIVEALDASETVLASVSAHQRGTFEVRTTSQGGDVFFRLGVSSSLDQNKAYEARAEVVCPSECVDAAGPSPALAAPLRPNTVTEGGACGPNDYYSFYTAPGCEARINLERISGNATLNLNVFDPNGQVIGAVGLPAEDAFTSTTLRDLAYAGDHVIDVEALFGGTSNYRFEIEQRCGAPPLCPLEGRWDNTTIDGASFLDSGYTYAAACPSGDDWYQLPIGATLTYYGYGATATAYDANGAPLPVSPITSGFGAFDFDEGGFLHVLSEGAATQYLLEMR